MKGTGNWLGGHFPTNLDGEVRGVRSGLGGCSYLVTSLLHVMCLCAGVPLVTSIASPVLCFSENTRRRVRTRFPRGVRWDYGSFNECDTARDNVNVRPSVATKNFQRPAYKENK